MRDGKRGAVREECETEGSRAEFSSGRERVIEEYRVERERDAW